MVKITYNYTPLHDGPYVSESRLRSLAHQHGFSEDQMRNVLRVNGFKIMPDEDTSWLNPPTVWDEYEG